MAIEKLDPRCVMRAKRAYTTGGRLEFMLTLISGLCHLSCMRRFGTGCI